MKMKLIRYKKPSVKNLTGYTKMKRRAKRSIGLSQLQAFTKPSRIKQKAKYSVGLYSKSVRIVRNTSKGKLPSPLGLLTKKK